MKKIVSLTLILFFVIAVLVSPSAAHAVLAHKNFIFGADSTQSVASQKGAKGKFTIVVPQTFTASGEDHN